jgi:hypothetical protein|tara:strand:- start:21 stop:413 length:393 start_codon:yes stop_codon:yes gene_type:complete
MASKGNWTVVFEDKCVVKNFAEGASEGIGYIINDDSFWSDSKFSNIWAIQYGTSSSSEEVEYRDDTPHSAYDSSVLGNISQFTDRWDAAHLAKLQADWDGDVLYGAEPSDTESQADQIARKGARPTSYSS